MASQPGSKTNSSFQNYPTSSASRKRKCGICAVLQDVTNQQLETAEKRSSMEKAKSSIQKILTTTDFAPRGNPTLGTDVRYKKQTPSETPAAEEKDDSTLYSIFKNSREAFDLGAGMLLSYIQKNASYEVQKAVAVSLMATAMTTFGQDITNAARVASEYTQFSEQTVRKWAFSYFVGLNNVFQASPENVNNETIESELSSERGLCHSCPSSLIHDEGFQMAARTYVRENAYVKGEPNLTVGNFSEWVEGTYSKKVHHETARRWLHELGFNRVHHQKGVYFDGHDRTDVVADRKAFLELMKELDTKSILYDDKIPELNGERPLIRVVHDESTFHANCDQTYFWGDEETNVLRQKSLGAGIMVSDFVDEVGGFVRTQTKEARLLLELSKDGYFNNDHLLEQVERTIDPFA